MLRTSLRTAGLLGGLIASAGSATVMKGTSQPVSIVTSPPGAVIYVDGKPVGVSPYTTDIKHGDHTVQATLNGYAPGYARLTSSFSGWTLLNVFGFVGIVVDVLTGSITTLDQDKVIIELAPASAQPRLPPQQPGGSAERH